MGRRDPQRPVHDLGADGCDFRKHAEAGGVEAVHLLVGEQGVPGYAVEHAVCFADGGDESAAEQRYSDGGFPAV